MLAMSLQCRCVILGGGMRHMRGELMVAKRSHLGCSFRRIAGDLGSSRLGVARM